VINKFEDHQNDESGDFRDYKPSEFNKQFGGFKYIFPTRNMSESTKEVFEEWSKEVWSNKDGDSFLDCHTPENLAYRLFYASDIPADRIWRIERNHDNSGIFHPTTFYEVIGIEPPIKKVVSEQDKTIDELYNKFRQPAIIHDSTLGADNTAYWELIEELKVKLKAFIFVADIKELKKENILKLCALQRSHRVVAEHTFYIYLTAGVE